MSQPTHKKTNLKCHLYNHVSFELTHAHTHMHDEESTCKMYTKEKSYRCHQAPHVVIMNPFRYYQNNVTNGGQENTKLEGFLAVGVRS